MVSELIVISLHTFTEDTYMFVKKILSLIGIK